jgi:hypothetical protein
MRACTLGVAIMAFTVGLITSSQVEAGDVYFCFSATKKGGEKDVSKCSAMSQTEVEDLTRDLHRTLDCSAVQEIGPCGVVLCTSPTAGSAMFTCCTQMSGCNASRNVVTKGEQ